MDVAKLKESAKTAVEHENFDYAITLLADLLQERPDDIASRKVLRNTSLKRFHHQPASLVQKAMFWLKVGIGMVKITFSELTKKPDKVIPECEKLLAIDPTQRFLHWKLGKACERAGRQETAVWVFEYLCELAPSDVRVWRTLGELYHGFNRIDDAINCAERVEELRPTDPTVGQWLRQLAALKTIQAGHYDQAGEKGGFKKMLKDQEGAQALEQRQRVLRTQEDFENAVERVKKDLAADPENKKLLLQLGGLCTRLHRFDEGREVYARAKRIDEHDFSIDEQLGSLEIAELEYRLRQTEERLEASPNDAAAKAAVNAARKERDTFATEHYRAIVAQRPTDLRARFRLGELLFRGRHLDEAMAEFQQAVSDPRRRRQAKNYLGLCLLGKKLYDLAIRQFEEALEGMSVMTAEIKAITYNLGLAAEGMGDLERAEESFKRIYEADVSFKDVGARVEALYKRKQASSSG